MAPTLGLSNSTRSRNSDSSPVPDLNRAKGAPASSMSTSTASMAPTARKIPQCSRCKRPRAGHPRSGCPFTNLPPPTAEMMYLPYGALPHSLGRRELTSELFEALGARAGDDDDIKGAVPYLKHREPSALNLARTPPLLSTKSKEVVESLSQPRFFHDSGVSKGASQAENFQELVAAVVAAPSPSATSNPKSTKNKPRVQPSMPSTLIQLYCNTDSVSSASEMCLKQELPSAAFIRALNDQPAELEENISASKSNTTVQPSHSGRLSRITSTVESDLLLAELLGESLAAIYMIPKVNAGAIVNRAAALKLMMELVMSKNDDDPNALIILGREEQALQTLFHTVATDGEGRKVQAEASKGLPLLRAITGAAVIGAISAWVALASA